MRVLTEERIFDPTVVSLRSASLTVLQTEDGIFDARVVMQPGTPNFNVAERCWARQMWQRSTALSLNIEIWGVAPIGILASKLPPSVGAGPLLSAKSHVRNCRVKNSALCLEGLPSL